ncbi:MAG: cell division protein ZipA [Candidatus Parabeggiatoa sp. nov. 3]|nr:MAG: cell division protein ZipA [Gammaproteobacteria bacterium]RKZ66749.1 MAG: cell division protein ZipA [Gammaproteobacteria bacterium]RKZ77010.1 MAG: cell division protein ZipA [Gammaproteobacteria bacterium]
MNNLFLILSLIAFAILVLGSLLIWKRKGSRRSRRKIDMAARPENDLYADNYFDNHLQPLSSNGKPDPLFDDPILDELAPIPEIEEAIKTQNTLLPEKEAILGPKIEELDELETDSLLQTETLSAVSEKQEETVVQTPPAPSVKREDKKSEMIIVLYVVAQRQSVFTGRDILTVFEDLGLQYGKMKIFHHYGIGELKVQQAIFSIANLMEPGTFNPHQMDDLTTEGLVLFMRLPGPFGGRVAFELMLNNAGKLAEVLEGTVEDERHTPLNQKLIGALRDKIANFEQRSSNLSMLKRFS